MNDFFQELGGTSLRLVLFLLATAVGLGFSLAHVSIRHWRNKRNTPTEEKKQELLRLIQAWKAQGYSYSERLGLLREQGYRKDVADTLLGEAEKPSN